MFFGTLVSLQKSLPEDAGTKWDWTSPPAIGSCVETQFQEQLMFTGALCFPGWALNRPCAGQLLSQLSWRSTWHMRCLKMPRRLLAKPVGCVPFLRNRAEGDGPHELWLRRPAPWGWGAAELQTSLVPLWPVVPCRAYCFAPPLSCALTPFSCWAASDRMALASICLVCMWECPIWLGHSLVGILMWCCAGAPVEFRESLYTSLELIDKSMPHVIWWIHFQSLMLGKIGCFHTR